MSEKITDLVDALFEISEPTAGPFDDPDGPGGRPEFHRNDLDDFDFLEGFEDEVRQFGGGAIGLTRSPEDFVRCFVIEFDSHLASFWEMSQFQNWAFSQFNSP